MGGADYVEIWRETVTFNGATVGRSYPAADTDRQIDRAYEETIKDLERVIGELYQHRDRLVDELLKRREQRN